MKFLLSDESINSYGFRILTAGINLDRFRKNPVMFYNHQRHLGVIGRWENIHLEGNKLYATPVFSNADKLSRETRAKVEEGTLRATSVGIQPLSIDTERKTWYQGQTLPTVLSCIMKEISIVDIPSNENAVKLYDPAGLLLSESEACCLLSDGDLTNATIADRVAAGATFVELSESDPEGLAALHNENPTLFNELAAAYNSPVRAYLDKASAGWSLRDWEKRNPEGLRKIMTSDPNRYASLFENTHGYKPTVDEIKQLLNY